MMNPVFSNASLPGALIAAVLMPISYIWLAFLGEWQLIGWSIITGVIWNLLAQTVNRPDLILRANPNSLARHAASAVWALFSHIGTLGLTAWSFFHVAYMPNPNSYVPALMVGYFTAISSIYILVEKDWDETTGWDTLLNAQALYGALLICFFSKTTLGTSLAVTFSLIALKPAALLIFFVFTKMNNPTSSSRQSK
jgi:hypothetical protein